MKEIIEDQFRSPYGTCWGNSIIEICKKYKIEIEEIRKWDKRTLKKVIKERINKSIDITVDEKSREMKKLRFLQENRKSTYIKALNAKEARLIMKARLNMLELRANFRGKYEDDMCDLCLNEEDTTEHMFECIKLKGLMKHKMNFKVMNDPSKELAIFLEQAMLIKDCVRQVRAGSMNNNKLLPKSK